MRQYILFGVDWANGPTPQNVLVIAILFMIYIVIGSAVEAFLQSVDQHYKQYNSPLAGLLWFIALPCMVGWLIGKCLAEPPTLPTPLEVTDREKQCNDTIRANQHLTRVQKTPTQTETVA